ncbi:acetyltransferase [Candidatus Pelagibacter sp.]|nr:acetyltransferase [Candidatus Pelagibacter sp.]
MKKKIKKLIIFGSGTHAKICLNEFLKIFEIKKIYFFNNVDDLSELKFLNKTIQVIKKFEVLKKKIDKKTYFFIGVGDNAKRKSIFNETLGELGKLNWLKLVSKHTIIDKSVKIGDGSAVLPGVVINFKSIIGDHCIINTKCSIDHDCFVDNFVNISPGANIAGNVIIGKEARIGMGASIKEDLKIEENVSIGANSFANKNCKKNQTYLGLPAKAYSKKKKYKS